MDKPRLDTEYMRQEQYRDRWSSYGQSTGILSLSERLGPADLRKYGIFQEFDDEFLQKLSPDVSLATWAEGSVLFEEGSYIDLGFVVVDGDVELFLKKDDAGDTQSIPIFDANRTVVIEGAGRSRKQQDAGDLTIFQSQVAKQDRPAGKQDHPVGITFLSVMDFDLPAGATARIGTGEMFGELGALSGWPQSVTARTRKKSTLLQIRVSALRSIRRKSKALKQRLDDLYRERSLGAQLKASPLFRGSSRETILHLMKSVELVSCDPGDVIVKEGEKADAIYMVRSGFVKLSQQVGVGPMGVTYLSKGMTFGEIELLLEGIENWTTTASSVEYAELVRVNRADLKRVLDENPGVETALMDSAVNRIREIGIRRRNARDSKFLGVALESGLVQGNSILVIDLNKCTRCDDCVRGCAESHGGLPRFVREGEKYENLMIAKSCYHCRDPVCLIGCPTGAIRRANVGDVVEIEDKLCVGCAACARGCPYDAIMMYDTGRTWPDNALPEGLRGKALKLASKCDLCYNLTHDPACVVNCPNDCAFRIGSLDDIQKLLPARNDE